MTIKLGLVPKSEQLRSVVTLVAGHEGHPAPRHRLDGSTCRAQRGLRKNQARRGERRAFFRREVASCAPEAAALLGNSIAARRLSAPRNASEHAFPDKLVDQSSEKMTDDFR